MSVRVITAPSPVVTWSDAKAHLRVEDEGERDHVEGLIAAATGWIDGPAGWLGRCLGPQLLEFEGWFGGRPIGLPFGPALELVELTTEDAAGSVSVVDASTYRLRNGAVWYGEGAAWVHLPVHRIRYWAGYGRRDPDDATRWIAEVPAPIRQAILLLVGHWYANREEVVTGTITAQLPLAADALLSTFRVFR